MRTGIYKLEMVQLLNTNVRCYTIEIKQAAGKGRNGGCVLILNSLERCYKPAKVKQTNKINLKKIQYHKAVIMREKKNREER